jgi:hypothetical protein
MPSPYQNIYFYYRGPSAKALDESEPAMDRQLEDNTTKALINVLEHSAPSLTASFLRKILGEPVAAKVGRFVHSLQGAEKSAKRARRRWLVAISMLGSEGVIEDASDDPLAIGRIDAAIARPDDLLVVFEVIVGSGQLGRLQLDQHAKKWGIAKKARRYVRWEEVYDWAEEELKASYDPITRFLLSQFLEFLELTGLSPFRGLRDEDFEFFVTREPERQVIVKDRLTALGNAVLDALGPAEREALGEIRIGQIRGGDHAWLCTHDRENVVNLTIELHVDELQVNVVGWSSAQGRRFEQWLDDGGFNTLKTMGDHRLVIFERSAYNIEKRSQGAKPWFQQERSRKVDERAAAEVTRAWVTRRVPPASDRSWQKPGFHLRRGWPRADVVRSRERTVADVVKEFRAVLPLLSEINGTRNGRP